MGKRSHKVYEPKELQYGKGDLVEITTFVRQHPMFVHLKGQRRRIIETFKGISTPYKLNGIAQLFFEQELILIKKFELEEADSQAKDTNVLPFVPDVPVTVPSQRLDWASLAKEPSSERG